MKKSAALLLVFLMLLLCSCTKEKGSESNAGVSSFFNSQKASFSVSCGEFEGKGEIEYSSSTLNITVTYPVSLKGLELTVTQNDITVSHNGLSVTKETHAFPDSFFAREIYSVLKSAEQNLSVEKTSEGKAASGTCPAGEFRLNLDSLGRIKDISIPAKQLFISFEYTKDS